VEVYAFASELEKLHPGNRHIKDKIRQQLQVLRDAGIFNSTGARRVAIKINQLLSRRSYSSCGPIQNQ
jgi:hypothetical protein